MKTRNAIRLSEKGLSISVGVFIFREDGVSIAYSPSLDLSGYDRREKKAKADFGYMLHEWWEEQSGYGTLLSILPKHGRQIKDDTAIEPDTIGLLRRQNIATEVFSLPEIRQTNIHAGVSCQRMRRRNKNGIVNIS